MTDPNTDPALQRGLTRSRYSRRQFLRNAGVGVGALSMGAILAACGTPGIKTAASTSSSTGVGSETWWAAQKLNHAASLFIRCETQQEVDYYWGKLLEGGREVQCGWLVDKFGLSWQVVPEILLTLLEDKDKKADRAMQAMLGMVKLDIAALKKAHAG